VLHVQRANGKLELRWPGALTGYFVESSPGVNEDDADWTPLAVTVNTEGEEQVAVLPQGTTGKYFVWWSARTGGRIFHAGDVAGVAQVCNLLYRRFSIGNAWNAPDAHRQSREPVQVANRRYSRLKICATVKALTAHHLQNGVVRCAVARHPPRLRMQQVTFGLIGGGTVGGGVYQALQRNGTLMASRLGRAACASRASPSAIPKRSPEHHRARAGAHRPSGASVVEDQAVQVVVELMGGTTTAKRGRAGGIEARQAGRHRQQGAAVCTRPGAVRDRRPSTA
jgi:hypothetical protein